jgi:hypothetical protein
MDRTFSRRKNAESLLGPELEKGNLTPRDYDALVAFVPGSRWKTDIVGLGLGAVIASAWTITKRPNAFLVTAGGYCLGETLGRALRVNAHVKYLRSIEDVNGFSRAMENIKDKVGFSPGMVQLVKPLSSADLEITSSPFQKETDTPYGDSLSPEPASASTSRPPLPSSPPAVKSRWEEIRAARRADGPSKAWENIRQGKRPDGTPIPQKSEFETLSASEASPFRDSDRAAAQASFDALLERERRMGSPK